MSLIKSATCRSLTPEALYLTDELEVSMLALLGSPSKTEEEDSVDEDYDEPCKMCPQEDA